MPTLLIVGAGPRLGGAIARRFGAAGYDVALLSDDEESVAALGTALQDEGITAGWAIADTHDDEAVRAAIGRFAAHTGGIDVALHNVSVWRDASVLELTTEQVLDDVHAGAGSIFTIAQAVVPAPRTTAAASTSNRTRNRCGMRCATPARNWPGNKACRRT